MWFDAPDSQIVRSMIMDSESYFYFPIGNIGLIIYTKVVIFL